MPRRERRSTAERSRSRKQSLSCLARHTRAALLIILVALPVALAARAGAAGPAPLAQWAPVATLRYVVDLSPQRGNGEIIASSNPPPSLLPQPISKADAGLWAVRPGRAPSPFAPSYVSGGGDEAYMVMAPATPRRRCSFGDETLYMLRLVTPAGVTAIDRRGRVRQFATIPGTGFESGIALDETGHFGYRLLVTVNQGIESTLYGIDCHGHVRTLVAHMPKVEGGLAVAPPGFGRFGGYLIGADEFSGHVYGIPPNGLSEALATVGAPGQDSGVESLGFVPPGFGPRWRALVADRVQPEHPPPGDGAVLGISGARLAAAGVRPGDLLVVTEAGAHTFLVRCRTTCYSRHVADGPATAHIEGHIVFMHPSTRG
jgi:hypothetical protein